MRTKVLCNSIKLFIFLFLLVILSLNVSAYLMQSATLSSCSCDEDCNKDGKIDSCSCPSKWIDGVCYYGLCGSSGQECVQTYCRWGFDGSYYHIDTSCRTCGGCSSGTHCEQGSCVVDSFQNDDSNSDSQTCDSEYYCESTKKCYPYKVFDCNGCYAGISNDGLENECCSGNPVYLKSGESCCGTTKCTFTQTCVSGNCVDNPKECIPKTCSQLNVECGYTDDGCGKRINCGPSIKECSATFGSCTASGHQLCVNGKYTSCDDIDSRIDYCQNRECGSDKCGGSCGTCSNGATCNNGKCVCASSKKPNCPSYSSNSVCYYAGVAICDNNEWVCSYQKDFSYASCGQTNVNDNVCYYGNLNNVCSNQGWFCSGSSSYCDLKCNGVGSSCCEGDKFISYIDCTSSGCKYIQKDRDLSYSYCVSTSSGCSQAYWAVGGEVSPSTCCGDDSGEYYILNSNVNSYNKDDACCNSNTDCVLNGKCYSSGEVYNNQICLNREWSNYQENTCQDSDNGLDNSIKGTTQIILNNVYSSYVDSCQQLIDGSYVNVDSCSDSSCSVLEYYCEANDLKNSVVHCSNKGCNDGACNVSSSINNACLDSENGINISNYGYITYNDVKYEDSCQLGSSVKDSCDGANCFLKEYYCLNGEKKVQQFRCYDGCNNGVCDFDPNSSDNDSNDNDSDDDNSDNNNSDNDDSSNDSDFDSCESGYVPVMIKQVKINGSLVDNWASDKFHVEVGEKLRVYYELHTCDDAYDVESEVSIRGYDGEGRENLFSYIGPINVVKNTIYNQMTDLVIPDDIDTDKYYLRITIYDRTHLPVTKSYYLAIERPEHDVVIKDIEFTPAQSVKVGRALLVESRIKNMGTSDEEYIKVSFKIPKLKLSEVTYYDDLLSGDTITIDDMLVRIPIDAKPGNYDSYLTIDFDDGDRQVYTQKTIVVKENGGVDLGEGVNFEVVYDSNEKLVGVGSESMIPIQINNLDSESRTYQVKIKNAEWSDYSISPSSLIHVDANENKTFYLYVTPTGSEIGNQVMLLDVKATDDDVEIVPLSFGVIGEKITGSGDSFFIKNIFAICLLAIFILAFIVYLGKKNDRDGYKDDSIYY
jgi:hypothetical protein